MIKRICNRCGRLYNAEEGCNCNATKRAIAERRKLYDKTKRDSWYNSKGWRALSRMVRARDYNTDRLSLFFIHSRLVEYELAVNPFKDKGWYKVLADHFTAESCGIKRAGELIVVHHIIPREDDKNRWYDTDNLISIYSSTHELIHSLYNTKDKKEVQTFLLAVVQADL